MTERTDRELLELAARAAGEWPESWHDSEAYFTGVLSRWNPLEDDGDALRMAVKLGIVFDPRRGKTFAGTTQYDAVEGHGGDIYAATRRAIVRAAAAMAEGGEHE